MSYFSGNEHRIQVKLPVDLTGIHFQGTVVNSWASWYENTCVHLECLIVISGCGSATIQLMGCTPSMYSYNVME
jgi:hypothetical protein